MKKLLFTLTLLLSLASAGIVKAQSGWIPSEAAAGTYYLLNVGKQAFMTGGNNWDTRATLNPSYGGIPVTLISTDNANQFYVSTNPTYKNLFLGYDGYVDKGTSDSNYCSWTFTPVDGMENTYTLKENKNSKYWLVGRSADTKTERVTTEPTTNYGYWMLITKENMINHMVANASKTNPVDATFAIQNPYAGRVADYSCWHGSPSSGGVNDNYCLEKWNTTFDVYQILENMPNGVYKLRCQGFYRTGGGSNDASNAAANRNNGNPDVLNAKYYINDAEGDLMSIFDSDLCLTQNGTYNTSTAQTINGTNYYVPSNMARSASCFMQGEYMNEDIKTVVTDGTLRIGVKKTVEDNQDWAIFDNFILTYYGVDMDEMIEQSLVTWHSKYDVIVDQATDRVNYDDVLDPATIAAQCTNEEALAAYEATVWQAVCEVLTDEDNANIQFDITSLITNPSFDNGTAGWTSNGSINHNASYNIAELYGQGDVSISQTLANMPAGNYTLKAQSFYRTSGALSASKLYEQGTDVVKGSLFLGNTSQLLCNIFDEARYVPALAASNYGGVWQKATPNSLHGVDEAFKIGQYWNVLRATTDSDGDLNLGISIAGAGSSCWVPFDNFKLYYGLAKTQVSLSTAEPLALTDDTYADVTTDITLTAGQYNKVCLPFDLDETQTSDLFANAYTLAGVTSDGVGQLVPVYSMEAGKAYIVTVDADKTLAVNDVLIHVAQPDSIPVMWEDAATVGTFNGYTFDINTSTGVTVSSYTPVDWQNMSFTVNQENWRARQFLNNVTYEESSSSVIASYNVGTPMRLDQPHSVFIPVPQNSGELTVTVSKNADYSEPETFTFPAGTTLCEVPNLIPHNTYYYKVEAGGILTKGQFNTEGRLRMIKASSGFNIRDLGGWETLDGNRLRYGKIFRGGELNYGHVISDADKDELLRLGVGAEIDWRRDDETNNESPTTSILGGEYLYLNHDYANMSYGYDVNKDHYRQAFNFTLDNLRDEKAVYFHCRIGADRTGMYALLLEGLCGMTYDQLAKDYELTTYSEAGTREKSSGDFTSNFNYINALPGNTLQQKFFYYWNQEIGIDADDLLEFIDIMVGGESSITNSDLAFANEDGLCLQTMDGISAICSNGSTIVPGKKAVLAKDDGTLVEEVGMTVDAIVISFDDLTAALEPECTYTLTIPAGAVMKDGTENAGEVTLTFYTPMVFDGVYYLYSQLTDGFMGAGHDYGTCAFVDKYGLPFEWKVNTEGRGNIHFLDADNMYLYGDNWVYVDGSSSNCRYFETLHSTVDGYEGFQLKDVGRGDTYNWLYVRYGNNSTNNRMASNGELGDNFTNMNQTVFQFWTKAEHDARVNNYPTDNLNHVIEGAQITTTADDFDSYIATNWTPTDISSTLGVTTSFGSGITGWTYTQVRGEDGYPDYNNRNGYEYARVYAGTGTFACTISKSKLPRGIYKIELGGFSRHSTETTDVRLAEGEYTGITSAFLKANDEQVIFTSWYDTNKNAEAAGFTDVVYSGQSLNEQSKYVNEGCAENVVWIYLDGQTDLTLNVTIPWHRTQSYTVFNNLRVTQYSENVTINEADEQQATAKENVNATLVRTLQPGILNTFCVPFNLTAEQIAASPLKDTEIYQFGRSSDVMIIYDPATAIEAGKPYIVKLADDATESIVNPVFANVNIVETEGVTVGDDDTKVKFVGQPYFNKSINQQYPYVHYITTSGTSKRLSATGNIKGLRAYYLVPESSNGEVKAYFNDIASSIDEIATETINGNEAVFDLSGRRIDKSTTLMPGIYIINGKKVMVK